MFYFTQCFASFEFPNTHRKVVLCDFIFFFKLSFLLDQREEKEKEEEETKEENWGMFLEVTWKDDFIYVWVVFIFIYNKCMTLKVFRPF